VLESATTATKPTVTTVLSAMAERLMLNNSVS
jgi:hypothetical protein